MKSNGLTEKDPVSDAEHRVERLLQHFKEMVAQAQDMSGQARKLAARLPRIAALYRPVGLEIDRHAIANKRDAANELIVKKCRQLLASFINASAYSDLTHQRAEKMAQDAEEQIAIQRKILVASCLSPFALAIVAGIVITQSLSLAHATGAGKPADAAQSVAADDLKAIVGIRRTAPASVLVAIGEMQRSLVGLIEGVQRAPNSIATGSSQIARNTDLSSRIKQPAASLEETASAWSTLSSTVIQNSDNGQRASTLFANSPQVALKGGGVVSRVVGHMNDISSNSGKITGISRIVKSVAFQTNILALDAAGEAVRAGDKVGATQWLPTRHELGAAFVCRGSQIKIDQHPCRGG